MNETRKRVLIVDDSQVSATLHRVMLSTLKCDMIEARNGADAVEIAIKERPDLIVMDVEMPKLNGYDACRKLKNDILTKHIPIILVTSRNSPENVRMGFEAGCSAYMAKPVSSIEFMTKVKNYLGV